MTRAINSLRDIADDYDAIVLDQWGVLHDGNAPYPGAIAVLKTLKNRLAVLSNSGKRAAPNAARIAAMGFPKALFEVVMTSGEALWRDIAAGRVTHQRLCPITRASGDAQAWAYGLALTLIEDVRTADAVLLMGLPDDEDPQAAQNTLDIARAQNIPVLCTNPDRASPRSGGATVVSPGALAHDYAAAGGEVHFYGKPHRPVFTAIAAALNVAPNKLLMVGDSLEHDITGGHTAGWDTAFIRGGLHAISFPEGAHIVQTITRLAAKDSAPMPTFTLAHLG